MSIVNPPGSSAILSTGDIFGDLVLSGQALTEEQEMELRELSSQAAVYAVKAKGEGTRRAYRSAWKAYTAWCARLGFDPLSGSPENVRLYLTNIAGRLAVSTVYLHLAAIAAAHQLACRPLNTKDPRLQMTLEGIVREKGLAPSRQARAITVNDLRRMLSTLDVSPLAKRTRAMMLIGWGAALRRSELTALTIGDVEYVQGKGLMLRIRRSKTDQEGRGSLRGIFESPDPLLNVVAAWQDWMDIRLGAPCDKPTDPLFLPMFRDCSWRIKIGKGGAVDGLDDKAVDRMVKSLAVNVGLSRGYSGHSLRSGLATAAGEAGSELHDIMRQTGHRSVEAAMRYLRSREIWLNNVTEGLLGSRE